MPALAFEPNATIPFAPLPIFALFDAAAAEAANNNGFEAMPTSR